MYWVVGASQLLCERLDACMYVYSCCVYMCMRARVCVCLHVLVPVHPIDVSLKLTMM